MRLIVEITGKYLKLLRVSPNPGFKSAKVLALPLFQESNGVSPQVREFLKCGREKPSDIILIISRRAVVMKQLILPAEKDQDPASLATRQAAGLLPFPAHEILADSRIIAKEGVQTRTLTLMTTRSMIAKQLAWLKAVTPVIPRLGLSSLGIANSFGRMLKENNVPASGVVMIINCDGPEMEICFCRQERLLFSWQINLGLRECFKSKITFVTQVEKMKQLFREQNMGGDITEIFLVSSIPEARDWAKTLEQEYSLKVKTMHPSQGLDFNLEGNDQDHDLSWAACLGYLDFGPEEEIQLLPKEIVQQKEGKRRQRQLFRQAIMALAVFFALSLGQFVYFTRQETRLRELNHLAAQNKNDFIQAQNLNRFFRDLAADMEKNKQLRDILAAFFRITPPEISFQSLDIREDGQLTINAGADTRERVNAFQKKLQESPEFQEVNLQHMTERKRQEKAYVDFKIILKSERPKE